MSGTPASASLAVQIGQIGTHQIPALADQKRAQIGGYSRGRWYLLVTPGAQLERGLGVCWYRARGAIAQPDRRADQAVGVRDLPPWRSRYVT